MNNDISFIDSLRARLLGPQPEGSVAGIDCTTGDTVVFLIDNSLSMTDDDYPPSRYLAGVAAIGEYLVARLAVGADDKVAVIVFDDYPDIVCEDVSLQHAQENVLKRLERKSAGGGTDIKEALIGAQTVFRKCGHDRRKRLVLLTDGHGGDYIRKSKELRDDGVIIDVIGIGGSPDDVDEACLRRVASTVNTELRYRFIGDRNQLLQHFKAIANELAFTG